MKFDAKTILQELKKLKDKSTAELIFDWSIVNAWANKLKESKSKSKSKEVPEFIVKKFGSIENFSKYMTALYTELKRRNVNVKLKDCIKEYIKINENALLTVVDLYETYENVKQEQQEQGQYQYQDQKEKEKTNKDEDKDKETHETETVTNDLLEQLPNYILKRGFIRLVGSTVNSIDTFTRDPDESDVDIYVDMPAEEVPTWIHKKLHLMLSKIFGKPVQLIYQNPEVNGPTEDAIVLYDLVLMKRIEYEPAYSDFKDTVELSSTKKVTFKDIKLPKSFKTIYGLDNLSAKDIPFDNYVIQPKYNGMKVVIFNGGKDVYSEGGNNLPLDLSQIFVEKVPDNYVFVGEVWSDTLPRQTVIGKVKKGEMDKELTVTIYDVAYPEEDYRTQLQMIKKYVKPKHRVKNFSSINDAIKFVEKHPEFDGLIIKDLDTTSHDKKFMFKVKKEADIDVQVIRRLRNKNGTYKYEVGYLDGTNIVSLGETFSTKLKFEPNDIIEISCGEINYYEDNDVIKGYAMRVKGPSNNSKPYTKKKIIRIAKESGLLNVIVNSDNDNDK